ncbi:DNA-processing protein DprA [Nocardia vaccinii]|uniref:DNA-processing protein DprA n=1 Tax=Nocardia vaccinii TaxID=1822 RepID=UPI00082A7AA6|nr:DNA-processing protein DprA [Nocardia vaccinii]
MQSRTDTAEARDSRRHRAWALLSRVSVSAPGMVAELVHAHGPVEAANRVVSGVIDARYSLRDWERADDDLFRTAVMGGRLLTRDDPVWPARLADLDGLGEDVHAPIALWVRGTQEPDLFASHTIAVVGSRVATGYGKRVTHEFASDLARRGRVVVSGAAFGIDAAAHAAALTEQAPTIAVLPCGLDRPYPAARDQLLARIAETGLVISEYPPGTAPAKSRFLARNRIVAALSAGVLVCEVGLRSGAGNTVHWATRLHRPVAAVPGPITSAASAGCRDVIRTGAARLVTTTDQILDTVDG